MEIAIKRKLTEQDFENVIVTALEGGSNYWYMLHTDEFEKQLPAKTENQPALSERIATALFTDKEFKMPVRDVENEDEILGWVSQQSMVDAFQKASESSAYSYAAANIFAEEFDANDADVIFQLATMGEVTFG